MTEEELNDAIMEKLKEIRAMLEANSGIQYLSMAIHADRAIEFHNSYGIKGKTKKDHKGLSIDGYLRGDE